MPGHRVSRAIACGLTGAMLVAGCAGSATTIEPSTITDSSAAAGGEVTSTDHSGCADVIDVIVTAEAEGTYRFDVTVRSSDTGWDKYADLWEVRGPDGAGLGRRVLTHPHVEEQPFTRSQNGIAVPDGVATVTVVARDSVTGFCGAAYEVELP